MAKVFLSRSEIDINYKASNKAEDTPLLCATRHGSVEVTSLLISAGAEIEGEDVDALTPHHAAVNSRHIQVAEVLLKSSVF